MPSYFSFTKRVGFPNLLSRTKQYPFFQWFFSPVSFWHRFDVKELARTFIDRALHTERQPDDMANNIGKMTAKFLLEIPYV